VLKVRQESRLPGRWVRQSEDELPAHRAEDGPAGEDRSPERGEGAPRRDGERGLELLQEVVEHADASERRLGGPEPARAEAIGPKACLSAFSRFSVSARPL